MAHFRMFNKDTKPLNMSDVVLSSITPYLSEELNMEEDRLVKTFITLSSWKKSQYCLLTECHFHISFWWTLRDPHSEI